jgi:hypothetical protein
VYVSQSYPIICDGDATVVAFANPLDIDAQNQLRFALGTGLKVAIAKEDQIIELLTRYFPMPLGVPETKKQTQSGAEIEIVTSQSDDCDLDSKNEDAAPVGEIRDAETASIALQAAQTGHLVLSTLHTNDAPSAVSRLLHLGCDPFIIPTRAGVLAQRLVRRICSECTAPLPRDLLDQHAALAHHYGLNPAMLYHGIGCERCRYTRYFGRIGIYSYFRITPQVSAPIERAASIPDILAEAKRGGFVDIDEAALEPLRQGVTTITEIRPFLPSVYLKDHDETARPETGRPNVPYDD